MKICPTCGEKYADDALRFCLQDGTPLQDLYNEPATVAFGAPQVQREEPLRIDISAPRTSPQFPSSPVQEPNKSRNGFWMFLVIALFVLAIFGGLGVGALIYFGSKTDDLNARNTQNSPTPVKSNANANSANRSNTNTSSPTPTATPTPKPEIDLKKIKNETQEIVDSWKTALEDGNVGVLSTLYGESVNYYTKNGTTRASVIADKQRAFDQFDDITLNISAVSIKPDDDGTSATVTFDKEWELYGADRDSIGKAQSELKMKLINGRWRIVGERDIKIYYKE